MSFILPGGIGQIYATPGFSAWNPARAISGMTFTNSNRTATGTGTKVNDVAGTKGQSTGKLYFEITFPTVDPYGDYGAGVCTAGWAPTGASTIGSALGAAGISAQGNWMASYYLDGSGPQQAFTGPVSANGDVIGVAVDMVTLSRVQIWFRKGANWFNAGGTPTTTFPSSVADLISSTLFTVYPVGSTANTTMTINVGNAAFANAPPAGFVAWG